MRNTNTQNDTLNRAETKAVNETKKISAQRKEKLKDPETKAKLMDFIFGGKPEDKSPLS
jgi:hypothetical protein